MVYTLCSLEHQPSQANDHDDHGDPLRLRPCRGRFGAVMTGRFDQVKPERDANDEQHQSEQR